MTESTYGPEPVWAHLTSDRTPARGLPEQDGINWNYASTFDRTPARVGNRSTTRFERDRFRLSSSLSETDISEVSRPPFSHNELNSLESVQTVWSPTTKQNDVTLHFSLDIADNIEGLLEELSRLKRLGHFTEALEYFDTNLQNHLDLPLVAIEYADLLVEQGAYQRLHDLRSDGTLESPAGKTSIVDDGDVVSRTRYLYRAQFQLVELWWKLHFEGISRQALTDELNNSLVQGFLRHYGELPLEQDDRSDSTEVQIIVRWLLFLSRATEKSDPELTRSLLPLWSDWRSLYNALLSGGRIWEVRDLCTAMISAYGPRRAWQSLFSEHRFSVNMFLKDWPMVEYDESSYLAILDVLAFLSNSIGNDSKSDIGLAKECLQEAQVYATAIRDKSPDLTKSRPYLRWILAKEKYRRLRVCTYQDDYFSRFPGLTMSGLYLPVYIPLTSENPGWPTPSPKLHSNDTLQTAIQTSRQLGDYKTEAMCLEELICWVEDPRDLFTQLGYLEKSIQGDQHHYVYTCLSRYLLTSDEGSRRKLLQELEEAEHKFPMGAPGGAMVRMSWSKAMVESALYRALPGHKSELARSRYIARALLANLPPDVRGDAQKLFFPEEVMNDVRNDLDTRYRPRTRLGSNRGNSAERSVGGVTDSTLEIFSPPRAESVLEISSQISSDDFGLPPERQKLDEVARELDALREHVQRVEREQIQERTKRETALEEERQRRQHEGLERLEEIERNAENRPRKQNEGEVDQEMKRNSEDEAERLARVPSEDIVDPAEIDTREQEKRDRVSWEDEEEEGHKEGRKESDVRL